MALAPTSRRRALAAAASALAAIALAAAVVGRCGVSTPGPEAAVRSLVQAARAGDRKAVWQLLSPATQHAIEVEARRATDLVGSSTRYEALDLISIGSSEDVPPPTEFKVVRQDGDHATVEVAGPAGRDRLSLIRIGGRWRIELAAYGSR
ncbi:MAG TPA: hypothetical protein VM734_11710 [Kofleriaceae bacterium]|jgi:hypothetical protein|nr:hypothetical protein [Kofleriaceae bacterium]